MEDIIFFSVALLFIAGFIWLVYWSIGATQSILHNPTTYYLNARKKTTHLGDLLSVPLKNPLRYSRTPHLLNQQNKKSLLIATTKEIIVHEKARFFWEIVTPTGRMDNPVVLKPFTLISFADITSIIHQEEGADGWVLTLNSTGGDSWRFTHCAQNEAFTQTVALIKQQLAAQQAQPEQPAPTA